MSGYLSKIKPINHPTRPGASLLDRKNIFCIGDANLIEITKSELHDRWHKPEVISFPDPIGTPYKWSGYFTGTMAEHALKQIQSMPKKPDIILLLKPNLTATDDNAGSRVVTIFMDDVKALDNKIKFVVCDHFPDEVLETRPLIQHEIQKRNGIYIDHDLPKSPCPYLGNTLEAVVSGPIIDLPLY